MTSSETTPGSPPPSAAAAIDPEWSVNELLRRHPATARVLNACGIDTCCGGAVSLAEAARDAKLDLAGLLGALGTCAGGNVA